MEASAINRYIGSSPRKMRLVIDLIRGKSVDEALHILHFSPKHASKVAEKVLRSAVSNLQNKDDAGRAEAGDLVVKEAFVDGGMTQKRIIAAPMGRAYRIRKRSNHLTIVVAQKEQRAKVRKAAARGGTLAFGAILVATRDGASAAPRKFAQKECLDCHTTFAADVKALRTTHPGVKDSQCDTCPLRHGLVPKLILKKDGNDLCFGCHAKPSLGLDKGTAHSALAGGAKCSACHELARPLGKNIDRQGWAATVTRMQKVNGCPITDAEARAIIDYLVTIRGPAAR